MINKILKVNLLQIGAKNPRYKVTIEDLEKNEILYQVESFAGCIATMETQPNFTLEMSQMGLPDIATVARMQKLAWGHPMLALTCLDQLKEAIRPHLMSIRKFVEQTMRENNVKPNETPKSSS